MTTQIAVEPLDACRHDPRMHELDVRALELPGRHQFRRSLFCEAVNGKSSLPLTFVAIVDGKPAGMISLRETDFKESADLSPWVASLYVHPSHRNKGVSSLLVKRLEREAEKLGYKRLYLTTEDSKGLYEKLGWRAIDRVRTPYGDAALMAKDVGGDKPHRHSG